MANRRGKELNVRDRMEARKLGEIEQEILRRCPHCAEGMVRTVLRDSTGVIRWLHSSDLEPAVSCRAADLQPWREIARRASFHVEPSGRSRAIQEQLDRWAGSD